MAGGEVLLLTLEHPPEGVKVREVKGFVYAARLVSMTVAGVEDEINALLDKLREKAQAIGANAVLGVKLDVRRVTGAGIEWAMLLAYGTGVVLES
ncbi:MAG: heavy metal-binding domain-containing protein [Crenarchaeota archaeon]|nr:heavy metal-binding domain-containing protein [Thermoproteota archaeon]